MSEGTRARGRLMPAPFAMPCSCYAAQRSCAACGAGPLCVPVGGGPPARSPHASLRLGVVDLEARPGPAATHRHRGQALPPPTGAAARPSCALWTLRRPSHRRCSRNSRLSLLLAAPLVFWAPEGPAAREIATREPAARSGRSRSPPVPSGPSGALHTSGAWSLMCGSAR